MSWHNRKSIPSFQETNACSCSCFSCSCYKDGHYHLRDINMIPNALQNMQMPIVVTFARDTNRRTKPDEEVNEIVSVFCFYGSRMLTTKITMLWKKSLHFEIWRTRSYALYKRSCYTILKREQSPNSILKRQNSKLQVSFALWLAFMWHILD